MGPIDDRVAVDLTREDRSGLEDLASLRRLGHADPIPRPAGRDAVVEIEQDNFMSQIGIAGDGPAAAIFGVAGMAAGDDHLRLARRAGWPEDVAHARPPEAKARPSSSRRWIGGIGLAPGGHGRSNVLR